MAAENKKFTRIFDHSQVSVTACAVTKDPRFNKLWDLKTKLVSHVREPNQFWARDPHHQMARLKIYSRDSYRWCIDQNKVMKIPMPFFGSNFEDGWGELQFLIRAPKLVSLARHYSFDTRVNDWVPETQQIQPKRELGTHAYLSLRFYHQSNLPLNPSNWRWEPLFVSVKELLTSQFYNVDVLWEKEEIGIFVTQLADEALLGIPKHLLT